MSILPFIAKDSLGRPWPPDFMHEVEAIQILLAKLWINLQHLPDTYVVLANLQKPNADVVILGERGIGVIELKGYGGLITGWHDQAWLSDKTTLVKAGDYLNPFRQAQAYGDQLRAKILPYILPPAIRLDASRHDQLKFQTAVCFTNPAANLSQLKLAVAKWPPSARRRWESNFSVRTLDEIPAWMTALRFEYDPGSGRRSEPYRLAPETLRNLATLRLDAGEWSDVKELMPTGQPYAYLTFLAEHEPNQVFGLQKDVVVVGRSKTVCDVVAPEACTLISRAHARIERRLAKVYVVDQSQHGTYVDGKLVKGEQLLASGQVLSLGGITADERIGRYRFTVPGQSPADSATQITTSDK
jgi:hypothetical protein